MTPQESLKMLHEIIGLPTTTAKEILVKLVAGLHGARCSTEGGISGPATQILGMVQEFKEQVERGTNGPTFRRLV